jgi:hypothetical protein
MVISRIQGGLSNQMFQYAIARSYSLRYNTEYRLELSSYNSDVLRRFELNKFPNISINLLTENDIKGSIVHITDNYIFKDLPNIDILLDGYWQSEKYFRNHSDIIIKDFSMSDTIKTLIINKFPDISECISMHIRRSDYVHQPDYHPLQSLDYYKEALDRINEERHILVFSDDIPWCKENIKFDNVTYVENQDNLTDLYTMSLCKHNIIANSSFSWWGAYLNSNIDKKVVGPIKWFGPRLNLNICDILPESWIKI